MTSCPERSGQLSSKASACPHCGYAQNPVWTSPYQNPRAVLWVGVAMVLVFLLVVWAIERFGLLR